MFDVEVLPFVPPVAVMRTLTLLGPSPTVTTADTMVVEVTVPVAPLEIVALPAVIDHVYPHGFAALQPET
jgi:hypothetical protein